MDNNSPKSNKTVKTLKEIKRDKMMVLIVIIELVMIVVLLGFIAFLTTTIYMHQEDDAADQNGSEETDLNANGSAQTGSEAASDEEIIAERLNTLLELQNGSAEEDIESLSDSELEAETEQRSENLGELGGDGENVDQRLEVLEELSENQEEIEPTI